MVLECIYTKITQLKFTRPSPPSPANLHHIKNQKLNLYLTFNSEGNKYVTESTRNFTREENEQSKLMVSVDVFS